MYKIYNIYPKAKANEFLGARPVIPNAPGPGMSIPPTKDRNETERLALRTHQKSLRPA